MNLKEFNFFNWNCRKQKDIYNQMLRFWKSRRFLNIWLNNFQDTRLVERSKTFDAGKQQVEFYSIENSQ